MSSVKINGNRIRTLREEQELTQLYIATVVEVTPDTISRWENRKQPSIKKENAKKLAEALNVDFEEILALDSEEKDNAEEIIEDANGQQTDIEPALPPFPTKLTRFIREKTFYLTVTLICIGCLLAAFFWMIPKNNSPLAARRVIPAHAAPGSPFPVVVYVSGKKTFKAPLLIREEIRGSAKATGMDENGKTRDFGRQPRWIGAMKDGFASFHYTVLADKDLKKGDTLSFSGDMVTQRGKEKKIRIEGNGEISIAPYHWADTNKDLLIDDDEILMAYETFSTSDEQGVLFSALEEIWLAGGYRWNEKLCIFETTVNTGNTSKETKQNE